MCVKSVCVKSVWKVFVKRGCKVGVKSWCKKLVWKVCVKHVCIKCVWKVCVKRRCEMVCKMCKINQPNGHYWPNSYQSKVPKQPYQSNSYWSNGSNEWLSIERQSIERLSTQQPCLSKPERKNDYKLNECKLVTLITLMPLIHAPKLCTI